MRERLARIWQKLKTLLGISGTGITGVGVVWVLLQRAQDIEWLARAGLRMSNWLSGLTDRPWGDELLAFLASPYAPLFVIAVGVGMVVWAAFRPTREEKVAEPVVQPKSHQRGASPAVAASATPPPRSTGSTMSGRLAGTRSAKVEAMNLAAEITAWADSWDVKPAWIASDFEVTSEFQARFGARLEALVPFVPMLMITGGGVVGGVALVSDTNVARQIASALDAFANGIG